MANAEYFLFVSALLLLFGSMFIFDSIVRWEYKHHRASWENDGRPSGLLWAPDEPYGDSRTAQKLFWKWMWTTPVWMLDEPRPKTWLMMIRLVLLIGFTIGVIGMI
jgi:hypothetical protein